MPQYIVFTPRKKRHEETLREYYNDTILGTFEAKDCYKAIHDGAIHFKIGQDKIDVKSFRSALDWEKKVAVRKSEVRE